MTLVYRDKQIIVAYLTPVALCAVCLSLLFSCTINTNLNLSAKEAVQVRAKQSEKGSHFYCGSNYIFLFFIAVPPWMYKCLKPGNLRDMACMQSFFICMMCPEKKTKYLCSPVLNMKNFSHTDIDVSFKVNSLTSNTAHELYPSDQERKNI